MFSGVPHLRISKEVIPVSSIAMDEEQRSHQHVTNSSKAMEDSSRAGKLPAKHSRQDPKHPICNKPEKGGSVRPGATDAALHSMDIVSSSGSGEPMSMLMLAS